MHTTKMRVFALVLLNVFLSLFGVLRVDAWEVPGSVANSAVVVGYLYTESDLAEPADYSDLVALAQTITVADMDSNGNLAIPDGKLFLPGTRSKRILVSVLTTMMGMQDAGIYTPDEIIAAGSAQQAQLVQEQRFVGPTYNTDAHLYADFTAARQMAIDARPSDAILIYLMVPTGPMLVSQDDLNAYAANAVAAGASQFGLQPDDPGLAQALATVPTTYDPTAPANTAPTADAGADQSVASEEVVTLDGTASTDPDLGDTLTYAWTQTAGTAVTLSDATAAQPSFTAPTLAATDAAETLTFSLVIADNNDNISIADTVDITVNPPSASGSGPTVTIGCSQYTLASLGGSYDENVAAIQSQPWWGNSDLAREFANAYDAQVTTSLDGATYNLFSHSFYEPNNNVYSAIYSPDEVFNSNQNAAYSSPDNSFMTATLVTSGNQAPTASAGADQAAVAAGETVTLDGSGSSDPDSCDTLTYAWTQTAGTPVTLSDATAELPTFTAPTLDANAAPETLTFSLVVTDDHANASVADTVDVTVDPPTGSAGSDFTFYCDEPTGPNQGQIGSDQSFDVKVGDVINLTTYLCRTAVRSDLTSSSTIEVNGSLLQYGQPDLNGAEVDYSGDPWTSPSDSFVITVNDATSFSFQMQDWNQYEYITFTFNVTQDPTTVSLAASVSTATYGDSVTLTATVDPSDATGTVTFKDGTNDLGTGTLSGGEATLDTSALTEGVHTITADYAGDAAYSASTSSSVDVTIEAAANTAPTADAGADQSVGSADVVTLDGTASTDPDLGDTLSYAWTQTAGTTVTLSDATAAQPTFTATTLTPTDTALTLTFSLVVTDDKSNVSVADTVDITVNPPANTAPTANAGADQSVASADVVTLDGTASTDPDLGDTLSYAWTQTAGTAVTLSDDTAEEPSFTAPTLAAIDAAEVLTFSLVVTDGTSNVSVADTVEITVNPPAPTPASEFATHQMAILDVVTLEATRSLRATLSADQKLIRDARQRFIAERQTDGASQGQTQDVPFDVDGTLEANGTTLSSKGTFAAASTAQDGQRHLLFGDFNLQRDEGTGSSTVTLNGKIAWENSLSDKTLFGYFAGGELAYSNIAGAFTGNQDRVALNVGAYAVHEVADQVYVDGFVSFGVGRNSLEIGNGILDLASDYMSRSATLGAAVSGIIKRPGYEIWPELSVIYGTNWIGNVGFTGRAYGLVDTDLALNAGSVTLANIAFRPEFRVPFDGLSAADSLRMLTATPSYSCEWVSAATTEDDCGIGGELGLMERSEDGLTMLTVNLGTNRLDEQRTSSVNVKFDHRF